MSITIHSEFAMNSTPQFPSDDNGIILRRMYTGGDDLTQPRMIDYCFIFPDRQHALAFAESVDDEDSVVCISLSKYRKVWQAIVQRFMIPEHAQIGAIEAELSSKAEASKGKADGWGCMRVDRKK